MSLSLSMVGPAIYSHLKDVGYTNHVGRLTDDLELRGPYAETGKPVV